MCMLMSVHKHNDQGYFILGIQGCKIIRKSMQFITLIIIVENNINRWQKQFDKIIIQGVLLVV